MDRGRTLYRLESGALSHAKGARPRRSNGRPRGVEQRGDVAQGVCAPKNDAVKQTSEAKNEPASRQIRRCLPRGVLSTSTKPGVEEERGREAGDEQSIIPTLSHGIN